jgi:hypothetical protein
MADIALVWLFGVVLVTSLTPLHNSVFVGRLHTNRTTENHFLNLEISKLENEKTILRF